MDASDVIVTSRGGVSVAALRRAAEMLARVARVVDGPVLLAHVGLTQHAEHPARERPAEAKALIDVNGRHHRAHVAAPTMDQAIGALEARLRDRLDHYAQRRDALRHRPPHSPPHEWRHGDPPTRRPDHYPRPPEERELVRHKTYPLEELTYDEAIDEMERLDNDFHLFVDAATGRDALVYRAGGGNYEVAELPPPPQEALVASAEPASASAIPVPTLKLGEAVRELDLQGVRFLFFREALSGRGWALYRRYDGHYGLITPGASGRVRPRPGLGVRSVHRSV